MTAWMSFVDILGGVVAVAVGTSLVVVSAGVGLVAVAGVVAAGAVGSAVTDGSPLHAARARTGARRPTAAIWRRRIGPRRRGPEAVAGRAAGVVGVVTVEVTSGFVEVFMSGTA